MKKFSLLFIIFFFGCFLQPLQAFYSLRQFSSNNGLSNSAILSLCQDRYGTIWIGSCDGVNVYDGNYLGLYRSSSSDVSFSGNMIERIIEADDDVLWVQSNYALDRFDTRKQTIQRFREFRFINCMARSADDDFFILKEDGYIYVYDVRLQQFQKLNMIPVVAEDVQQLIVDKQGILWLFSSHHPHRSYRIVKESGQLELLPCQLLKHSEPILSAFVDEGNLLFIDQTYRLYEFDLVRHKSYYVADLEKEVHERGSISSIVKYKNDFFIGFKSSGLIVLKYQFDAKVPYEVQPTRIKCGVFCLLKDRFQDILWIGSDGQGMYMYFVDEFSVQNVRLDTPRFKVNNPVRALFLDREQTLWLGTKGGGILRLPHFQSDVEYTADVDWLTTSNSSLLHNAVYSFAPSRRPLLWIGTEYGLNYYSYKDRTLHPLPVQADGKPLKYVHAIRELNDSTLWVVSLGEGIVKLSLSVTASQPRILSAQRFVLDGGRRVSNYFFSMFQENDSTLWLSNRGKGVFRINTSTGDFLPVELPGGVRNEMTNDVLDIHINRYGHWLGTSFGLLHFKNTQQSIFNETDGFPNNTIHSIMEGEKGNLWLSTNQGVVRFNMLDHTVQTYRQQGDLSVIEFSDGASFKDPRTGTIFFGGITGFVTINENSLLSKPYMPNIHFNKLSIFGKEYNINDFFHGSSQPVLKLDYHQNFFSLSFTAVDHIHGSNYNYAYRVKELSDQWIENGLSNTAVFSNLMPGHYTLEVKYRSNINGLESRIYPLQIYIVPPWYMSSIAYLMYILLLFVLLAATAWAVVNRYRRKRNQIIEQMNQRQREELYESKLRFFTNITHEFCTPLTLINGPCEKILSYTKIDDYVRKYASMIQQNTLKLNALILELIEFRRLETGHKQLNVEHVCITHQLRSITESFGELAENRSLDYRVCLQDELYWNTDNSCLSKIVTNLISNAFKYTPTNGFIQVECMQKEDKLCIRISNSGKGIKKEDLPKLFDRYKILDNFEVQHSDGISPRNGLGLAICHSMLLLLNGDIQVSSIPDEITTFEVLLPMLEVTVQSAVVPVSVESSLPLDDQQLSLPHIDAGFDKSKRTLMIIDDDPSMLWFVSEIFVDRYNVISLNNAEDALKKMSIQLPDLIISDVMMPGMDGMTFARKIKSDKFLSHIPLILLSALNHIDEQSKGIDSGAEAYVTKPFNVEYLEKVVSRLLQREEDLKEYYTSSISSLKLDNGRLLHAEDQSFLDEVMQVIDAHLQDPALSVELLSSLLGYSLRQFYRRLKLVTDKTPADLIRDYRLSTVERLLLTTQLSVEEIIDKAGFANRGTFYKLFAQRYGKTPRQYRMSQKHNTEDKENTPPKES